MSTFRGNLLPPFGGASMPNKHRPHDPDTTKIFLMETAPSGGPQVVEDVVPDIPSILEEERTPMSWPEFPDRDLNPAWIKWTANFHVREVVRLTKVLASMQMDYDFFRAVRFEKSSEPELLNEKIKMQRAYVGYLRMLRESRKHMPLEPPKYSKSVSQYVFEIEDWEDSRYFKLECPTFWSGDLVLNPDWINWSYKCSTRVCRELNERIREMDEHLASLMLIYANADPHLSRTKANLRADLSRLKQAFEIMSIRSGPEPTMFVAPILHLQGGEVDGVKEDTKRRKGRRPYIEVTKPLTDGERDKCYRTLRDLKLFPAFIECSEGKTDWETFRKSIPKDLIQLFRRLWHDVQSANYLINNWKIHHPQERKLKGVMVMQGAMTSRCCPRRRIREDSLYGYPERELPTLSMFERVLVSLFPNAVPEVYEALKGFNDFVRQVKWLKELVVTNQFIGILSSIGSYMSSTNAAGRLCALISMASFATMGYGDSGLVELISLAITGRKLKKEGYAEITTENPFMEDLTHLAERVVDAPIPCKIAALVNAFLGSTVFKDMPMRTQLVIALMHSSMRSLGKDATVVVLFFDVLSTCAKGIQNFVNTGNIFELMGYDERRENIMDAISLMKKFASFRSRTPDPTPLTTVLDQAERRITKMAQFCAHHPKDRDFETTMMNLTREKQSFAAALSNRRGEPYALLSVGPPGCGKSTFPEYFGPPLAAALGMPTDIPIGYHLKGTKYQSPPGMSVYVAMDDIFQTKDDVTPYDVGAMKVLTELVGVTTFTPECAEAHHKDHALSPVLIYASTNLRKYQFSTSSDGASTERLIRRYDILEFAYTEKAEKWSAEHGVKLSHLLRKFPDEEGFVVYHLGKMRRERDEETCKTLLFTPDPATRQSFNHQGDLVREIIVRTLAAIEVENEFQKRKVNLCPKGYQLTPSAHPKDCACEQVVTPASSFEMNLTVNDIIAGKLPHVKFEGGMDLDFLFKSDDDDGDTPNLTPLVAVPAALASVAAEEVFDYMNQKWEDTSEARVKFAEKVRDGAKAAKQTAEVALVHAQVAGHNFLSSFTPQRRAQMAYGVTALITICGLLAVSYNLASSKLDSTKKDEGRIVSSLGLESEPPTPVHIHHGQKAIKYLGMKARPPDLKIERLTDNGKGYRMWALPISLLTVAFPFHFINTARHTGQPNMRDGEIIEFTIGTNVMKVPFFANQVIAQIGIELVFYRLSSPLSPIAVYWDNLIGNPINNGRGFFQDVLVRLNGSDNATEAYHDGASKDGDCGLPILNEAGLLLGFHIGMLGDKMKCYSRITPQMIIAHTIRREGKFGPDIQFSDRFHPILDLAVAQGWQPGLASNSTMSWQLKEGSLPPCFRDFPMLHRSFADKAQMSGRESDLFPYFSSRLHEEYGPPNSGSAKLIEGKWVSVVSTANEAVTCGYVQDPLAMEKAIMTFVEKFPKPEIDLHPLTFTQAVAGDKRNDFMVGKDTDKSVGPYLAMQNITKAAAFQDKGDYHVVHPKIREEYDRIMAYLDRNEVEACVAKATVKDEIYPMSSVAKGKGRLFNVMDVSHNLVIRALILPIIAYAQAKMFETGIIAAVNPSSPNWGMLYHQLNRFGGKRTICSDQSKWDIRISALLICAADCIFVLAKKLGYSDKEATMAKAVVLSLARQCYMVDGEIHLRWFGFCSGTSLTLFLNGLMNQLQTYYSVYIQNPGVTIKVVLENTVVLVQGDDKAFSISPLLSFSPEAMVITDGSLGSVTTHETKKGSPPEFTSADEAVILKRTFVFRDDCCFCPLDEKSIWKALCYTLGEVSILVQRSRSVNVIICMSYEAFMHGEKFFEDYCHLARQYPFCPSLESFASLMARYTRGDLDLFGDPSNMDMLARFLHDHQAPLASVWTPQELYKERFTRDPSLILEGESRTTTLPSFSNPYEFTELSSTSPVVLDNTATKVANVAPGVVEFSANPAPEPLGLQTAINDASLNDLLSQKFLVCNGVLSSPLVATLGITPSVFLNNPRLASAAGPYIGYKYRSIRITVTYSGNPQTYGGYNVMARPAAYYFTDQMSTELTAWLDGGAIPTRMQMPSVRLDISQPCVCSMVLPWASPLAFTSIGQNDYKIYIDQIGTLGNIMGITQPSCNFWIWAEYKGLELVALSPEGEEYEPNTTERAVAYARKVAQGAHWFISPIMAVMRLGVSVGEAFGYSRRVPGVDQLMAPALTSLAYVSGIVAPAQGLGMDPSAARSISGVMPGHNPEETKTSVIAAKWGCIALAMAPGNLNVHPCQTYRYGTSPTMHCCMTPLGYAASFFRLWRGDIKIKMTWYSTPLARGFARVILIPPYGNATPANKYTGRYHVIEISGTTVFEFTMPYEYVDTYSTVNAYTGVIVDGTLASFSWDWDNQPLNSAGATITINPVVEICSENMEFEIPTLVLPVNASGVTLKLQGAFTGEDTSDLLALTRRSCFNTAVTVSGTPSSGFPLWFYPPCGIYNDVNVTAYGVTVNYSHTCPTYLYWLSVGFYANSGGYVVTLIDATTGSAARMMTSEMEIPSIAPEVSASEFPYWGSLPPPFPSTPGGVVVADNTAKMIAVPDRGIRPFKWGQSNGSTTYGTSSALAFYDYTYLQVTGSHVNHVFVAGGEDFQVAWFLCAPILVG